MGGCSVCGDSSRMPYSCRRCTGTYCSDHRLPENHGCPGLPQNDTTAPWFGPESSQTPANHPEFPEPYGSPRATTIRSILLDVTLTPFVIIGMLLSRLAGVASWVLRGGWGLLATALWIPIVLVTTLLYTLYATARAGLGLLGRFTIWGWIVVLILGLLVGGNVADYADGGIQDPDESPGAANTTTEQEAVIAVGESPADTGLNETKLEYLVHERINEIRARQGLSELAFDTDLREIARYHSEDMAENDYFSHDAPGGEGLGDRYHKFGYDCRIDVGERYASGAENIYYYGFKGLDYSTSDIARFAVRSWMDSSGHRRNILGPHWRNEGIGVDVVASDGKTTIYVTQNFC